MERRLAAIVSADDAGYSRLDPQRTEARVILCSDYALSGARDQVHQTAREAGLPG